MTEHEDLMTQNQAILVRAFDGSLAEARGLLAVERATFDESPYSARQIQAMLTKGPQRAWLAVDQGKVVGGQPQVVGFAIAFATHGLAGPCWEVDLLAVHPHWRQHGLATRLIRAAAAGSPNGSSRARAVVATDNTASARAFGRAGFQPLAEVCTLLIYRPQEAGLRPPFNTSTSVHEASSQAEAALWLQEFREKVPAASPGQPLTRSLPDLDMQGESRPLLLLAERDGRPAGYTELIEVQTLLYRGAWIESLAAATRADRLALVEAAMQRGRAAGWDEVGSMVPDRAWPLKNALVAQGFRSLGDFRWLAADLPLPSSAAPASAGETGKQHFEPGHA
jgi:ribosomal protein S18 acetylase RimI-like enzyme